MSRRENHSPKGGGAGSKLPGGWVRPSGWLAMALVAGYAAQASAQNQQVYYPRTGAYFPYNAPEPVKYNIKLGKLTARVSGSVNSEFSDNVGLSETSRKADFSIGPSVTVGFLYPITKENVLQFDLGMGYRWYLNSPSINTISVAPNSHFDQTIIIENVRLNFHDSFSIQVDPLERSDISGTPGKLINFRRFHNAAGVTADWRPARQWGFTAGYNYGIDRSLADDFQSLDLDTHTFNVGVDYSASASWTLGIGASYFFTEYAQKIQNGGDGYSIGPRVTWQATKYISVDATAGFSVSRFDATGTIADRSDFTGFTYQMGVRHMINQHMSHDLHVGRSVSQGLGSNFTEMDSLQYALRTQLTSSTALGTTFAYETGHSSGGGEKYDRYLLSLGTGYQLTRLWAMGLTYSFAWKDSDLPGRNYTQNRITLDLSRQF